jgi:hypothetical protein
MTCANVFPFFQTLQYVWVAEGFSDDLFFNFDETGVNLWDNRKEAVVCEFGDKHGYVHCDERIKNVSLCFMVCCNGQSIPPAILWPSVRVPDEVNMVWEFFFFFDFFKIKDVL